MQNHDSDGRAAEVEKQIEMYKSLLDLDPATLAEINKMSQLGQVTALTMLHNQEAERGSVH